VLQQSQALDNHAYLIILLEAEKLDHVQGIHTKEEKVFSLEAELECLKISLQELENQKLAQDMEIEDFEEQVDILTKENAALQEEIEVMLLVNQAVERT